MNKKRRSRNPKISFSPSAIQTFAACERKSYLISACGLRQEQTKGQIYGDLIHDQLERYIKSGVKPTDERALEALKNLPKPGGRGVRAEGEFKIPVDDWREINGRLDLDYDEDWYVKHVMDHKTSKDPDKYAKTPEELRGDIQVNIYAYKVLQDYPEASEVVVSHHNIATQGALKSYVTPVDDPPLSRAEVENNFRKYLRVIDDMTEVWSLPTAFDADPTGRKTGECKKWGGCHLKQQCDTMIFRNLRKVEFMASEDLKSKLARLQAGTPPPKTGASPAAAAEGKRKRQPDPEPPEDETETETETEPEAPPPPKRTATKPAPAKPAKVEEPPPPPADDGEKAGPILLINCLAEIGVESTPLEIFMAPYLKMIEEQTGESWRVDNYGKGPGMLEMAIDSIEEFPEALTIDGHSYLGKNCLPALLRRNPQAVIRGTLG